MSKLALPDILLDIVSVRRMCVFDPQMVPAVVNGTVCAYNAKYAPAPTAGLSVGDFVLGYLALGLHHVPIRIGDFGTAICVDYAPLPSRWAARMLALHHAFVHRFDEVGVFFRETGLGDMLVSLGDADEIERFGSPRRALIVYALASALHHDGSVREPLVDAVRRAEPTATKQEIKEAALDALAWASPPSETEPFMHLESGRVERQGLYL